MKLSARVLSHMRLMFYSRITGFSCFELKLHVLSWTECDLNVVTFIFGVIFL